MAYFSQEMKKEFAPRIKAILKEYGVKGTISVRDYRELNINLKKGKLDIMKHVQKYQENRIDYNELSSNYIYPYYQFWKHSGNMIKSFEDKQVRDFLIKLIEAMNNGNYDNSNAMIDYHDVGWYAYINVGDWKKPYIYEA